LLLRRTSRIERCSVKNWKQHYQEFLAYCRSLTDSQLENVIEAERQRHRDNPDDEYFDACYSAAKHERYRRYEN